jgi:hypothetical protein
MTPRPLMRLLAVVVIASAVPSAAPHPDAVAVPPIVERFLTRDDTPLRAFVGVRHLEASARNGWKTASLDACTELIGNQFTYRVIRETGSGTIRKRVLIAALEGEARMRREGETDRSALSPANYTFSLAEEATPGETRVQVRPLRKEVALVDGAIFLESGGDLLRVEGMLAKPPSFWTRRVVVVRRYQRIDGVRVPVSMESTADVRLFGKASFAMTYQYTTINGVRPEADTEVSDSSECR